MIISTHASLAGGDFLNMGAANSSVISTHASLAGGDFPILLFYPVPADFNPRIPRGRRRHSGRSDG